MFRYRADVDRVVVLPKIASAAPLMILAPTFSPNKSRPSSADKISTDAIPLSTICASARELEHRTAVR